MPIKSISLFPLLNNSISIFMSLSSVGWHLYILYYWVYYKTVLSFEWCMLVFVYLYIYIYTHTPPPLNSWKLPHKKIGFPQKNFRFMSTFPHPYKKEWLNFLDREGLLTLVYTHFWVVGHLLFTYQPKELILENRVWESHTSAESHGIPIQNWCSSVNSHHCMHHEVVLMGLQWGKPQK